MDFNTYQIEAKKTALYPVVYVQKNDIAGNSELILCNLLYPALGISGEAGEVAEKIKKLVRNNNGVVTEEFIAQLAKELGDILWYISDIASNVGIKLDDVACENLEKLKSRQIRGKLLSEGDDR